MRLFNKYLLIDLLSENNNLPRRTQLINSNSDILIPQLVLLSRTWYCHNLYSGMWYMDDSDELWQGEEINGYFSNDGFNAHVGGNQVRC